jgi:hypothetical protein
MSPIDAAWTVAGVLLALLSFAALAWVRRKWRVRQAWSMIGKEREHNKRVFARAVELSGIRARQCRMNLAVLEYLQARPGAATESWPGQIAWAFEVPAFAHEKWQAVLRSGAGALIEQHQIPEVEELYTDLNGLNASGAALLSAAEAARRHAEAHPARSESQRLGDELTLARAAWTAHCRLGDEMRRFHELHTDFVPMPAVDE